MAQQNEKVYVVTGALGSIGTAICTQLARQGGTPPASWPSGGRARWR
ncbi:MAG: hypothetical protein ACYC8T_17305 [Myxococcaceae bacterium]